MEVFLVENKGVKIEVQPGLGRVAVATQDFKNLFEAIIREAPALVWSSGRNELCAFLLAYDKADESVQSSIQDLYHPPLASMGEAMGPVYRNAARVILDFPRYDPNFIKKLLAIYVTNAHNYFGHQPASSQDDDLTRHETTILSTKAKFSALFLFGSMPQHSCDPNVSYTSQTLGGYLEYKVIRKITAGASIEFAYIGDLFESPTFERREKLKASKNFMCMCTRCKSPDFTRVAPCRKCGEPKPCAPLTGLSKEWICSLCGDNNTEIMKIEKRLFYEFKHTQLGLSENSSTSVLYRIRNEAISQLSTTHFVTIRAWKELAKLYVSKAVARGQFERFAHMVPSYIYQKSIKSAEGLSKEQLRLKAAICGLRSIALSECVANTCLGCQPGSVLHAPVYSLSVPMFHACADLMELPIAMRPPYAAFMVQRYLPIMRSHFGEDDGDVAAIDKGILQNSQGVGPLFCDGCAKTKKSSEKLLACARCGLAYYCSKECQVKAWKSGHKAMCLPKI